MSEKKRKQKAPGKAAPGPAAAGKAASGGPAGPMNVGFLQQLVDLMSSNDLNTVDLRDEGRRIILKRGAVQPVMMAGPAMQQASPAMYAQQASAPAAQPASSGGPAAAAAPANDDAGLVPIKSPMVGTFYAAEKPDAKPFVSVGTTIVRDETDVCIIEAMKVFNNIKAEVSGTIAKVLVTNGQTVEFGTPLFMVKPS